MENSLPQGHRYNEAVEDAMTQLSRAAQAQTGIPITAGIHVLIGEGSSPEDMHVLVFESGDTKVITDPLNVLAVFRSLATWSGDRNLLFEDPRQTDREE